MEFTFTLMVRKTLTMFVKDLLGDSIFWFTDPHNWLVISGLPEVIIYENEYLIITCRPTFIYTKVVLYKDDERVNKIGVQNVDRSIIGIFLGDATKSTDVNQKQKFNFLFFSLNVMNTFRR